MFSTKPCQELNEQQIAAMENLGFKRWAKHGRDRLYINYWELGVEYSYYNSGNICGCKVGDEYVSNSEGGRIKGSKFYIDLKKRAICIDGPCRSETREYVQERIEEFLASVTQDDSDEREEMGDD